MKASSLVLPRYWKSLTSIQKYSLALDVVLLISSWLTWGTQERAIPVSGCSLKCPVKMALIKVAQVKMVQVIMALVLRAQMEK